MSRNKPQLASLLKRWGLGLLLCTSLGASHAATSSGQFSVNITLTGTDTGAGAGASTGINTAAQSAPGVCISQTLSEQTNAVVRVVCGTGQFVSITANPNARFLGTNGGAPRFVLSQGSASSDSQIVGQARTNDFYPGTGTVTFTSVRIYNVSGTDGPFEMMVTF
jgi:hypothetical protein